MAGDKNRENLLETVLNDTIRKKYKLNVLFGDIKKAPLIPKHQQWFSDKKQTEDDIREIYNLHPNEFTNYGYACGSGNIPLIDIDVDWAWVYPLLVEKFGERITNTFTVKTINGGMRLLYTTDNPKGNLKFIDTIHTEIHDKKYVACYGKAIRDDGEIGEYVVVNDVDIKKDNSIIDDVSKYLGDIEKKYDFLSYNCIKAKIPKKIGHLDHPQRMALSNFMIHKNISEDEGHRLFMFCTDFDESISRYQFNYTKEKVDNNELNLPTCETLRKWYHCDEEVCKGCLRKKTVEKRIIDVAYPIDLLGHGTLLIRKKDSKHVFVTVNNNNGKEICSENKEDIDFCRITAGRERIFKHLKKEKDYNEIVKYAKEEVEKWWNEVKEKDRKENIEKEEKRRLEAEQRATSDGSIDIPIGRDNDFVRMYNDTVQMVFVNVNAQTGEVYETPKSVIAGFFKINKKYLIDDNMYYDISIEKKEKIMSMDGVVKQLRSNGKILKKGLIDNTIQAIAASINDVETGHAAIGVYNDGEKLELCLDPIPITDEQGMIWTKLESKKVINYDVKKEDIEQYHKYNSFFHPYEIYPIMGFSVMAPFDLIIKEYHILMPLLYLLGKQPSIGKSSTAQAYTEKAFGMDITSAERLNSDYRYNEIIDSACLPQCFDEGEMINFDKMITIREACENKMVSSRGRPDLTQIRYMSRLFPIFTGNDISAKKQETLKRIVIVHFDETRVKDKEYEKNATKIDSLLSTLKPIGYEITKHALSRIKTSINLYKLINHYKNELQKQMSFMDITKAWSWAVCYVGLKIWESFCKQYHVEWAAPSLVEFGKVIRKVETTTWGGLEEPTYAFRDWFEGWLSGNTSIRTMSDGEQSYPGQVIKGENEIWMKGIIETKDKEINGYWITNSILQQYNREARSSNLPTISNLKRLAESVNHTFEIPLELIAGESGGKPKKIGGKTRLATFIPINIEGKEKNI